MSCTFAHKCHTLQIDHSMQYCHKLIHRVWGGGSKFLIPRSDCRLCSSWVSSGQRQRQQILNSKIRLLPLLFMSFIGSTAEAANSWFQDQIAAFALHEFHWVFGRGSKFLIPRSDCCLCSSWVSSGQRQRQQNACFQGAIAAFDLGGFHWVFASGSKILLLKVRLPPLLQVGFMGSMAVATKYLLLWPTSHHIKKLPQHCGSP